MVRHSGPAVHISRTSLVIQSPLSTSTGEWKSLVAGTLAASFSGRIAFAGHFDRWCLMETDNLTGLKIDCEVEPRLTKRQKIIRPCSTLSLPSTDSYINSHSCVYTYDISKFHTFYTSVDKRHFFYYMKD